jgi:hypothetical protein
VNEKRENDLPYSGRVFHRMTTSVAVATALLGLAVGLLSAPPAVALGMACLFFVLSMLITPLVLDFSRKPSAAFYVLPLVGALAVVVVLAMAIID